MAEVQFVTPLLCQMGKEMPMTGEMVLKWRENYLEAHREAYDKIKGGRRAHPVRAVARILYWYFWPSVIMALVGWLAGWQAAAWLLCPFLIAQTFLVLRFIDWVYTGLCVQAFVYWEKKTDA